MKNVNWLAVLAALGASMLIGFLWYGQFLHEAWMVGNGITMEGEKYFKNGLEMPMSPMPMIINSIVMVAYALFMNWLINMTGDATWQRGAMLGAAIGCIMALSIYVNNNFAFTPHSLTRVDASYALVLWTIIGAIMGGLRKK